LPVDGAMTLGEDYVATPEKCAGVKKANEKLTKDDRKAGMDELYGCFPILPAEPVGRQPADQY
jgi:hypothetical protein